MNIYLRLFGLILVLTFNSYGQSLNNRENLSKSQIQSAVPASKVIEEPSDSIAFPISEGGFVTDILKYDELENTPINDLHTEHFSPLQGVVDKPVVSVIPQIGFSNQRARLEFKDPRNKDANFPSAINLSFGFQVEARLGKFEDKWAIFGTFDYTGEYNSNTTYTINQGTGQEREDKAVLKYQAKTFSFGFKHYLYIGEDFRVFPSLSFGIRKVTEDSFFDTELLTGAFLQDDLSLDIGLGFEYRKKISIGIQYALRNETERQKISTGQAYIYNTAIKAGYRFYLF